MSGNSIGKSSRDLEGADKPEFFPIEAIDLGRGVPSQAGPSKAH